MKNYITKKFEAKKKIDSEIEVLKRKRTVAIESINKKFDEKIKSNLDATDSQIKWFKAEIEKLEKSKETKTKAIEMKREVALNKKVSSINRQIISKQNISRSLSHHIDAENRSIQDTVIFADTANTPNMYEELHTMEDLIEETKIKEDYSDDPVLEPESKTASKTKILLEDKGE